MKMNNGYPKSQGVFFLINFVDCSPLPVIEDGPLESSLFMAYVAPLLQEQQFQPRPWLATSTYIHVENHLHFTKEHTAPKMTEIQSQTYGPLESSASDNVTSEVKKYLQLLLNILPRLSPFCVKPLVDWIVKVDFKDIIHQVCEILKELF